MNLDAARRIRRAPQRAHSERQITVGQNESGSEHALCTACRRTYTPER